MADSYLGRVFGAFGTTNAVTLILGSLLAGGLADTVGVSTLLFAAALYSVAGLIALAGLGKKPPIQPKFQSGAE